MQKQNLSIKRVIIFFGCISYFLIQLVQPVHAQDLNVTAQVIGKSTFIISGYTSPNSTIYLYQQGSSSNLGSYQATIEGLFYIQIDLNLQGTQILCLKAQDVTDELSDPVCFEVNFQNKNNTFTRIVMPPTFRIDRLIDSDGVRISGYTLPNAVVQIIIDGQVKARLTSNAMGFFAFEFNPNDYSKHSVTVLVTKNDLIAPTPTEKYFQLPPPQQNWISRIIILFQQGPSSIIVIILNLYRHYRDLIWLLVLLIELVIILILEHSRHRREEEKRKKQNSKLSQSEY